MTDISEIFAGIGTVDVLVDLVERKLAAERRAEAAERAERRAEAAEREAARLKAQLLESTAARAELEERVQAAGGPL